MQIFPQIKETIGINQAFFFTKIKKPGRIIVEQQQEEAQIKPFPGKMQRTQRVSGGLSQLLGMGMGGGGERNK